MGLCYAATAFGASSHTVCRQYGTLSAAEKTADPDRFLFLPPQSIEVGLENPLKATGVFAVANEGFQFESQRFDLSLVVPNFGNLGDPVIEEFKGCGGRGSTGRGSS